MNELFGQIAHRINLLNAGAAAAVGGLAGGGIYLSFSGVLLGIMLVLGALGLLAIIVSIVQQATGASYEPALAGAGAPAAAASYVPSIPVASAPAPQPVSPAMASTSSGSGSGSGGASKIIESTLPAGAPIEAVKIEATETEAELLAAGRFSEYHLAKAKRFFASKNFKDAAYQAAASLAHGDLPEAKELRKQALAAAKG